jgi:hypothetical protein
MRYFFKGGEVGRGRGYPRRPPTPPDVRVRIRRFRRCAGGDAAYRAATPAPISRDASDFVCPTAAVPASAPITASGRFRPPCAAWATFSRACASSARIEVCRPTLGTSCSGLRPTRLLCPLLTSARPSRHLSMAVAQSSRADLPGYCALTFPLMPVGFTPRRSVQVSGFDENCRLTPTRRLISASCSSGQRFAFSFLRIRSRPRHPCRSANPSPCQVGRGLAPPSERALPGAQ